MIDAKRSRLIIRGLSARRLPTVYDHIHRVKLQQCTFEIIGHFGACTCSAPDDEKYLYDIPTV
jgi:hypothetical protein